MLTENSIVVMCHLCDAYAGIGWVGLWMDAMTTAHFLAADHGE